MTKSEAIAQATADGLANSDGTVNDHILRIYGVDTGPVALPAYVPTVTGDQTHAILNAVQAEVDAGKIGAQVLDALKIGLNIASKAGLLAI